jgi:DNA-directed RNA polymerase specialized sigma24 family protein
MLLTSKDWWAKPEWTQEHFKLARRIMRGIHVLPPDWTDDIVQEVAMRYPGARRTGKGGNYEAWLRTVLFRKAIDMLRKDQSLRWKNRPVFVSLESLEEATLLKGIKCSDVRKISKKPRSDLRKNQT